MTNIFLYLEKRTFHPDKPGDPKAWVLFSSGHFEFESREKAIEKLVEWNAIDNSLRGVEYRFRPEKFKPEDLKVGDMVEFVGGDDDEFRRSLLNDYKFEIGKSYVVRAEDGDLFVRRGTMVYWLVCYYGSGDDKTAEAYCTLDGDEYYTRWRKKF